MLVIDICYVLDPFPVTRIVFPKKPHNYCVLKNTTTVSPKNVTTVSKNKCNYCI